jgi:3-hydroxy-9,10-secoandrosta-1,3,5(10)-triene-9,17-dione monooxygenase reductase component
MSGMEQKDFRNALGRFATGVTVITTFDAGGTPVGVTANSFNSVSLDPPMILWSLAKTSHSMSAFADAHQFAVHILSADQESLSNQFAAKGTDKFAGISLDSAEVPLLTGCAARFLCHTQRFFTAPKCHFPR